MLDLGFVSAILADKSFEEVIDFASQNKFKCVEIMCWPKGKAERRYAGVTHIDVDMLDDQAIDKIQSRQNLAIRKVLLHRWPGPINNLT